MRRTLAPLFAALVAAACPLVFGAAAPAAATTLSPADLTGVDGTPTPTNFWLYNAAGAVWSFGSATDYGAPGTMPLTRPIVTMTPTSDAKGYWSVGSDGGVFSYGDAPFYGSTGGLHLVQPIVGMAPTADGKGYWLVASDGGLFAFGDAGFFGSMGGSPLARPIIGMASASDGKGYWMLASDGGVFAFGDAPFYGSTGGAPPADPVEKIVRSSTGKGYWIVEQTGTAHHFGDASGPPPASALLFTLVTPGDKAVAFAFNQLGKPYIWGGNGPVGYDCSGLALASWQHGAGVSFARVANDQYHTAGVPVGLNELQTGDLVFWGSDQTDWTSVYHTAIYVGGGRIVESTGDHVQLNSLSQWGSSDLMPEGRRP